MGDDSVASGRRGLPTWGSRLGLPSGDVSGDQVALTTRSLEGSTPDRRSFLSTLVQVASGGGEGDLEAALSTLSLEGADEMLPCQIRLFKGWWGEWGHDNRSNARIGPKRNVAFFNQ